MAKIVVIGSGFAGMSFLKGIVGKRPNDEFFLISDRDYFLYNPRLFEYVTGELKLNQVFAKINSVFSIQNFKFINDIAIAVNADKKTVKTRKHTINYDYLILAYGSSVNYFNTKGAEQYCTPLKTLKNADDIISKVKKCRKMKKANIAIVGAGPTGVELAFALKRLLLNSKITILQSGNDILTGQSNKLVKYSTKKLKSLRVNVLTNSAVDSVSKSKITYNKKQTLPYDFAFWTAGVKANEIKIYPSPEKERGRLVVDDFLRVINLDNVYAVGDCANMFDYNIKGSAAPTAQASMQGGKFLSKHFINMLEGKQQKPLSYANKGTMIYAGKNNAAIAIKNLVLSGFFPSITRNFYYSSSFNKLTSSSQ